MDLASGIDEFLAALQAERGLAANTIAAYRRDLRNYIEFLDGSWPTPDDVSAWLGDLRERGRAPTTVARKLAAVRGLHRFLVAEGLAGEDPTVLIESPRRPQPLPKALERDEVERLLDSPNRAEILGRRDRALLEFLYGTGARVGEAVGLDAGDVDLESATAVVTGKGSKQRMVPLGTFAVEALIAAIADRPALQQSRRRTDALFLNARGGRLTRQGAWLVVRRHARRVGIPDARISPHVLRHSAATHMLEGGADLRTVQEILGHATMNTTQVYTRVSPQHLYEIYVASHPRSR